MTQYSTVPSPPHVLPHEVSPFLRLCVQRALYLYEVANALGVKRQSVSKWAQGHTQPALRHRKELAALLEVDLDTLLEIFPPRPRRTAGNTLQTEQAAPTIAR